MCRNSAHRQACIFCIAENLHPDDHQEVSETLHRAEVGRRLRIAIEAVGTSQAGIGRDFNVAPSKIGNWLRGDNYPSEWFVKQFCDRYGVTTDWLYRGIVSGMSSDRADAIWKLDQASTGPATAPKTPRRKTPSRPVGTDPPPFPKGGRVNESRAEEDCGRKVVPYTRIPA